MPPFNYIRGEDMKSGNKCAVCIHQDRDLIDQRLVSGLSVRAVADEFGIGRMSVQRHRANHLPAEMVKAKQLTEVDQADKLLERVEGLYDKALRIQEQAESEQKYQAAVGAIKEARSSLELIAKLVGELKSGTHINLTYSPQWVSLRQILVQTLEPYPEIRGQVVEALEEAEKVEVLD